MKSPSCANEERQNKDGFTNSGSQRYRRQDCGARYTPEKKLKGYQKEIRELAIRMNVEGLNFRQLS